MSLRTRLLLTFAYLIVLLLVAVSSSAFGLHHLGRGIEAVLDENYESVSGAMGMLDALERQDSATLTEMLQPGEGRVALAEARAAFDLALARVRRNVTLADEGNIIGTIEAEYAGYERARDALLGGPRDQPLADYERETFERFLRVKAEVRALLDVNHQAMMSADQQARLTADRTSAWLAVLGLVALFSVVAVVRNLQHQVFRRLDHFRETASAIAAGDRQRRLLERGSDELAAIANRFDEALDARQHVEHKVAAQLELRSQLVLTLMARAWPTAVVYGLDGTVLVAPGGADVSESGDVVDWIRDEGQRAMAGLEPGKEVTGAVGETRLSLLVFEKRRPLGWLAETAPTPDGPR